MKKQIIKIKKLDKQIAKVGKRGVKGIQKTYYNYAQGKGMDEYFYRVHYENGFSMEVHNVELLTIIYKQNDH